MVADTIRRCVLVAAIMLCWHPANVQAQCIFGFSDRVNVPTCPIYNINSAGAAQTETVQVFPEDGGPNYTVTQTRLNVEAEIGWCESFKYPRSDSGSQYFAPGTVGAEEHSYIMTYGDPWCNTALLFNGCLEDRRSPYHPPSYAVNMRPAVLHDPGASTAPVPPYLPMWDEGGYFFRTVTVRVNDSCLDPEFDPQFEIRSDAFSNVFMSIVNGSLAYGFPQTLNISDVSSADWSRVYVTSRIAECPAAFLGTQAECVSSYTTCDLAPVARCNSPERTLPIRRYPSKVELACRDPEYGYVWRVQNNNAPGLHFDWRLTRTDGSLIDPIGSGSGDLSLPSNVTGRNPLYNDPLIGGFWPGTSGKHTAAPGRWFFIPTWLDAGNTTRPSNLELYAGYPGHYNGTTTLGALIAFFEFESLLEFDMLNATGFSFFAYDDVPKPAFPDDFERQAVLHICETPGLATAASNYVTGGAEDWDGWCQSAVLSTNATWPDALALTQATFAPLTPGDPDPMPVCACGIEALRCDDTDLFGDPLRFQYDYTRTVNLTVDYRLEPVCRMPEDGINDPLNVTNLPPLSLFPGPSSPIGNATVPLQDYQQSMGSWPDPYTIVNVSGTEFIDYPTLPFGVMWNLSNVNRDPIATSFLARFSFSNTAGGGGGVPNTTELTVPYEYTDSNVILEPLRSRWLFSRTLIGQHVFGHINWPCIDLSTCKNESTPKYPPDYSPLDPNYVSAPRFAEIDVYLPQVDVAALPLCECLVNVPCDEGILLEETDLDVNVSALLPPPAPPPGPPTIVPIPAGCIATLEVCNCLDDNCDGIVDNVLGVNTTCGISAIGHCELGMYVCNISSAECNGSKPLTCDGAVYPELERCDNQDWDCDGTLNNVPYLGEPCGSNVGVCEYGTWACDTPNPDPICVGGVQPAPNDTCGNGLDDDCDGLIDFNCVPAPPPTASPIPTASPPPPPPPPTTGPAPSGTAPTAPGTNGGDGGLDLPQIDAPDLQLNVPAIVFSAIFLLVTGGTLFYCVIIRRRRRWRRRKFPLFF